MGSTRDNLAFGEFVPYWTSVVVDESGYMWLRKHETAEQREESGIVPFRVLSPEGEYLGDTRCPFSALDYGYLRYASIAHGYLVALVLDADTRERIPTVFRLIPRNDDMAYP
jgi:hypothetical protein